MPDIAIIGAGFSGLGTAIRLRQQGIEDFVVLERHDDVGGTWWANTYPGCACDVPSHLYSFSFAPNPDWSQTYSAWDQIPIPIGPHNPGLILAFRYFVTDRYRRFQRIQIDALRPHLRPDAWITHNFMHWYPGYDHYALSEDLDLAAWDAEHEGAFALRLGALRPWRVWISGEEIGP